MSISKPFISIDRIIERIYDEYGLPQVYRSQAMEWAVDIMLLISPTEMLIDKTETVYVEHGRGRLPSDFHEIKPGGLRDKTTKQVLVPQSGAFSKIHEMDNGLTVYSVEGTATVVIYDADGNLVEDDDLPKSFVSSISSARPYDGFEYILKDGWVFCGLNETVLELSYKALNINFKTREPLIPDDTKVINAIVAGVAYKIAKKLFITGQIQQTAYQVIEQDYLFNIASARSGHKVLSPERMESLKRGYLSLMPRTEEHRTGFSSHNK